MDVFEALEKRRSVRKFLEVPLNWEQVAKVIEAAHFSPTAGNAQDVRCCVVLDPDTKQKIAEACLQQYWILKAPVHIVVGIDPDKNEKLYGKRGVDVYTHHDAGAAIMAMLLAAEAQGLAACWVGAFEESLLKNAVGIPDGIMPEAVLILGYPDEKPAAPLKFGIETMIYINSWGNKYLHLTDVWGDYSRGVDAALKKAKEIASKIGRRLREV